MAHNVSNMRPQSHYVTFLSGITSSQAMVTVQMLSELEEIIQYKLMPERREAIKQAWWFRLQVN